MGKIDISSWKDFYIKDIFETIEDKKNIQVPTGASISKKNLLDGNQARISVKGTNNGIVGYFSSKDKNYRIYKNFISVSFLGTVFYHEYEASLDMKVHCLKPKKIELNKYIALYLVASLKKMLLNNLYVDQIYSDQISSTVLPNMKFKLPVDKHGEPNWMFMENYIRNVENKVSDYLSIYLSCNTKKTKIDTSDWKEFMIEDIFTIDMGTKLDRKKMKFDNPTIDFVGRANTNQGVTCKVNMIKNVLPYKPGCLTLALGGEYLGSCFIQKNDFYTSQNVIVLIPKENISYEVKQFIATSIFTESQLHYKAFIDELNRHVKKDFVFKLPADKKGNPDYKKMEIYIKNLIKTKQEDLKILNYC